jgi:hypothetical protein
VTSLASIVRAVLAAIAAITLLAAGTGTGVSAAHASSASSHDAPAHVAAVAHAAFAWGSATTTPPANTRTDARLGKPAAPGWSRSSSYSRSRGRAAKGASAVGARVYALVVFRGSGATGTTGFERLLMRSRRPGTRTVAG